MLQICNLNYSYGSRKILDSISFKANKGEIVALLGPNGVGKSTLLKCLAYALKPSSASIFVKGKDVHSIKYRERSKIISWVPQHVPVSSMTVFDAVLLGRKPYINFQPAQNDLEICANALEALGISSLALCHIDRISGGEYQKVQLCRAFAQEPQLLILDEPSNNLDLPSQYTTLSLVSSIVRNNNICTIMSMHDINLALQYADRFLFLSEGQLIASGDKSIITEALIKQVYGITVEIIFHKGKPLVVPVL